MFEDLRSPKGKARAEAENAKRIRQDRKLSAKLRKANRDFAGAWHPIETMPFDAYANSYGIEGAVLLSDGAGAAVASISRRFGRPVKVIKQPHHAFTDNGMMLVGGEYEEFDWPKWMFDWEFTDLLGHESEMWGKPNIKFQPTIWQPLPMPPKA